ncbi:MAG: tripartite tricarboxylate transporter substrate binding protein [Pseudomonadota bacterium]
MRKYLSPLIKAVVIGAAVLATTAYAQTYPARQIRLVVPYTPGTGMDTIARVMAPKLAQRLGQPVVVENMPGASGNIGANNVAKANGDGYTLMLTANTMLIASNLYKAVPFNPLTDFAPISLTAYGTLMLVSHPQSGINSVADLLTMAKAEPGKLTYSSPGVGTPHHMAMELLSDVAGIKVLHVPYKGSAGALTDLLGGQVNVGFVPVHVAMTHVKSGKLKALAVGSPKRNAKAPDVPTLQESGIRGAEADMWYAVMAPKGTPAPIVTMLNTEVRGILQMADVKGTLDAQGLDPASDTPEELMSLMRRDSTRWADIIRKNKISMD